MIVVSHYPVGGEFGLWDTEVDWADGHRADKPWLLAGELTPTGQEYYIVYLHTPPAPDDEQGLAYVRSVNDGYDWVGGDILVNDERVLSDFCAQPTVFTALPDAPLYVAFMHDNPDDRFPNPSDPAECLGATVRFIVGQDINDGEHAGEVSFSLLRRAVIPGGGRFGPSVKPLEVSLACGNVTEFLPWVTWRRTVKTTPWLAVDPTNADRLFLVYQDLRKNEQGEPTTDVDIFLRVLSRLSNDTWLAGDPIRVNNDQTLFESDQCLPSVLVDTAGRIHVIFYDDRRFNMTSNQPDLRENEEFRPQFDVFYAYSQDHGVSFINERLFEVQDPLLDPPAVDYTHEIATYFELGEYIGLSCYRNTQEGRDEIWTSFSGSEEYEPEEQSVIWSSYINWWDGP